MIGSRLLRTLLTSGVLVGIMSSTAFGAGSTTLSSKLLAAKNLGTTWSVETSNGYTKGLPPCAAALYKTAPDQTALARRTFRTSTGTETFQDRLVSFSGSAAVARTTALENSIASCPAKSDGDTITVHKLAFPAAGEQSEAFRVLFVVEASGVKVTGVFGLARQGSTVIVSTHAQRGTGTTAGTKQGEQFATLAIKKA